MLCFIDDRLVSTSAHKKEETRERDKERINRIGRDDDHRGIQFDSNPKTQQQTLVVVYVVVVVVKKKAREEENKRRGQRQRKTKPRTSPFAVDAAHPIIYLCKNKPNALVVMYCVGE